MVSVLAIAGSDPSGGAGIEADLRVFAALGVHGRTAITALTLQNYSPLPLGKGQGEGEVHSTSPDVLRKILSFQERDSLPDAIKIGMIGTRANLDVVCDFLGRHPQIPVVLDPVLSATSGLALLEAAAVPMLREKLWPRATVVTPNLDEVGMLLGHQSATIAEMESAARELHRGTQIVVVKGGHLTGDPVDVAFDGHEIHHFTSSRIKTPHTRGTGCTYASAVAAYLAQGSRPMAAIRDARTYLVNYLRTMLR